MGVRLHLVPKPGAAAELAGRIREMGLEARILPGEKAVVVGSEDEAVFSRLGVVRDPPRTADLPAEIRNLVLRVHVPIAPERLGGAPGR